MPSEPSREPRPRHRLRLGGTLRGGVQQGPVRLMVQTTVGQTLTTKDSLGGLQCDKTPLDTVAELAVSCQLANVWVELHAGSEEQIGPLTSSVRSAHI
jgi:hypothetical protein